MVRLPLPTVRGVCVGARRLHPGNHVHAHAHPWGPGYVCSCCSHAAPGVSPCCAEGLTANTLTPPLPTRPCCAPLPRAAQARVSHPSCPPPPLMSSVTARCGCSTPPQQLLHWRRQLGSSTLSPFWPRPRSLCRHGRPCMPLPGTPWWLAPPASCTMYTEGWLRWPRWPRWLRCVSACVCVCGTEVLM